MNSDVLPFLGPVDIVSYAAMLRMLRERPWPHYAEMDLRFEHVETGDITIKTILLIETFDGGKTAWCWDVTEQRFGIVVMNDW